MSSFKMAPLFERRKGSQVTANMNGQQLYLCYLVYLGACLSLALCQQNAFKMNVGGTDFLLFRQTTETFVGAKKMCQAQNAKLALFYTNDEYYRVTQELTRLNQANNWGLSEVWVDIVVKDDNRDGKFEHWWEVEEFKADIWAITYPDTTCVDDRSYVCCARLTWQIDGTYVNLQDSRCAGYYNVLCKISNACLEKGLDCDHMCVSTISVGFHCQCKTGYNLETDGRTCTDIDECDTNNGDCQQKCNNTQGSYNCECDEGYKLATDMNTCQDVDECTLDNGNCQQECNNTIGSFECTCRTGYQPANDGSTCEDENECKVSNGDCDHQCVNVDGSYRCQCKDGYQLNSDNKTCSDIDECAQTPSPCINCTNTDGNFTCGCSLGYEEMNGVCEDINECQNGTHRCTHECHNVPGSYTCSCPDGYETSPHNKLACVDIDECQTGQHICEQNCTNTEGNFSCSCLDGFKLDSFNNVSCHDIDECAENASICHHGCINTAGSYHCTCRTGFRLDQDEVSCVGTNRSFVCPCNCLTKHRTHEQREESVQTAEQVAKEIQKTLKVDVRALSATMRKKVSVKDKRTSSETIGYMGVAFFSIVLGLTVLPDVMTVIFYVKSHLFKGPTVSPECLHF